MQEKIEKIIILIMHVYFSFPFSIRIGFFFSYYDLFSFPIKFVFHFSC